MIKFQMCLSVTFFKNNFLTLFLTQRAASRSLHQYRYQISSQIFTDAENMGLTYTYVYVHIHNYMHISTHTYIYICYRCIYEHIILKQMCKSTRTLKNKHTCMRTHIYVYIYRHTITHEYLYTTPQTHTSKYTFIDAQKHVYIHIHK